MGVTLRDFFEYLHEKRVRLTIWREVTTHLQNEFLPTDVMEAPKKLTLDSGEEVSEEDIEEVIDTIYQDYIAPLQKKIVDLMDTELDEKLNELRAEKKEERKALEEGEPSDTPAEPPKLRKHQSK